ncbi:carbonic anhydrase [Colletotrichum truncatum]|uniref:Carbonic anhydrase n=1 Tax=Colletotrichum truncatum TaxID=5467 RepID=A0ACC3YWT7_COLTU|nr:carbonic anhydrase [Colletotrichum truncatum]KAF6787554.1 carbonic anhydrase [Colletotrichum truncatum]
MVAPTFFAALLGASMVTACADHSTFRSAKLAKRADYKKPQQADWAYEASFDWGRVNSNYRLCQAGTQQSPIAIGFNNGLATKHQVKFNYPEGKTKGTFYNWNYGPAFTIEHPEGDYSGNPSFTYDNTTVYLSGWHIHTPADHTVSGWRSRAEMHFVHVNEKGTPSAVLAFRLDPSSANDEFFAQMPPMIGFNETDKSTPTELDLNLALKEVSYFGEFWTYQGSLTSPPCTEGIRWFVARNVMFLGDEQLSAVLGASTYSARAEQQVWRHKINE